MTDVIGGQVPLTIDTVTATRPQVESGKLKPIAITTAATSALLPGVKSVAEQGVPGFQVTAWNALFAPNGTPKPIIDALSAQVSRIIAQPETQKKLMQLGFEPQSSTPEQLGEFVVAERKRWGELIRAAAIKID
jgi:tripartite-type tricarboxylate transporter receptor subunit TctC